MLLMQIIGILTLSVTFVLNLQSDTIISRRKSALLGNSKRMYACCYLSRILFLGEVKGYGKQGNTMTIKELVRRESP